MSISVSGHSHGLSGSLISTADLITMAGLAPSFTPSYSAGLSFTGTTTVTNIDLGTAVDFRVHGKDIEHSDKFKEAKDIFFTDLRLDKAPANYFHFLVWKEIFGETFEDYGTALKPGVGFHLAFASSESRNQFDNWFARYTAIFYKELDTGSTYLPDPVGGELNGIHVVDFERSGYNYVYAHMKQDDLKDWTWIAEHCYHPVYRFKNGWFFTSPTEAIHFKMRPTYEPQS